MLVSFLGQRYRFAAEKRTSTEGGGEFNIFVVMWLCGYAVM